MSSGCHNNMDERAFQIQRMLADELDWYKGKDNKYVGENIQEIQELYKDEERREKEGRCHETLWTWTIFIFFYFLTL